MGDQTAIGSRAWAAPRGRGWRSCPNVGLVPRQLKKTLRRASFCRWGRQWWHMEMTTSGAGGLDRDAVGPAAGKMPAATRALQEL